MFEQIISWLFNAVMIIVALFSFAMVYELIRFGKSKVLTLVVSGTYLLIMLALYGAAAVNLSRISFDNL